MAVTAGKAAKFYVGTSSASITGEVVGINSVDASFDGEQLDTTSFANNAGYRQRALQGLKQFSFSISGDGDHTDTTGQNVMRNAWVNGTDLYAKFLPDGVNGWSGKVRINFKESASVDGKHTFSAELTSDGALTVVGS